MRNTKITKSIALFLVTLIPFVYGLELGIDGDIGVKLGEQTQYNYTVNASEIWLTAEGDLDDAGDIQGSWINNDLGWISSITNLFDQILNTTSPVTFSQVNVTSQNTNETIFKVKAGRYEYQGEVPSDIGTLDAHWDFNLTAQMDINASNHILLADDLVGGYELNGTYQPTYECNPPQYVAGVFNGNGVARFNRTERTCFSSTDGRYTLQENGDHTLYVVFSYRGDSPVNKGIAIYGICKNNMGNGAGLCMYNNDAYFRFTNAPGLNPLVKENMVLDEIQVLSMRVDNLDSQLYDGEDISVSTSSVNGNGGGSNELMGSTYNEQTHNSMDVAEVILYSNKLSVEEHEMVLAYLESRYGKDYPSMTYHSQQDAYVNVTNSNEDDVFSIDSFYDSYMRGSLTTGGSINILGGLSVANVPVSLTSGGDNFFNLDHNGGEAGYTFYETTTGGGHVFMLFENDGGQDIFKLTSNIYRGSIIWGNAQAGSWNNASVGGWYTSASTLGAAMNVQSDKVGNFFCLGNDVGTCVFSDVKYTQFSQNNLKWLGEKLAIEGGGLWMTNESKIKLGENREAEIYFNKSHLVVNSSNTTMLGNLNVHNNFTGNQIYAEMYGVHIGDVALVEDIYNNVSNLTEGLVNGFVFDNSTLTAQVGGVYKADSQWSFSGTANNEYHLSLGINYARQENCHAERVIGTGADVGSASITCLISLSVDDVVNMQIENVDSGGDATIHDINLNLVRIGT